MKKALTIILFLGISAGAQSGGPYTITKSVLAGGGSQNAAGGTFELAGTSGQGLAGTQSAGGQFVVVGGFWAEAQFAPTAANPSLSGRIVLNGSGMQRITIELQNLVTGAVRTARPNAFGYYRFDDVPIGDYLIRPRSGNFIFSPSEMMVSVLDNVADLDFAAGRAADGPE